MKDPRRGALVAVVALAAGLGTGCNLTMLPYFLFAPEAKVPPKLKRLAAEDKKKEVKVVLLTYSGLETRPELIQADRQLSELFAKELKELCEYNKEKVTVVSPRKVEEYKSSHPGWHQDLDLGQIGRHFKADYVIYLEMDALSIYERGSGNMMYRGRADITVALVDVNDPDKLPDREQFSHIFPSEGKGPVPVGDVTLNEFRQAFLGAVAKKLTWYFTAHPTASEYDVQ